MPAAVTAEVATHPLERTVTRATTWATLAASKADRQEATRRGRAGSQGAAGTRSTMGGGRGAAAAAGTSRVAGGGSRAGGGGGAATPRVRCVVAADTGCPGAVRAAVGEEAGEEACLRAGCRAGRRMDAVEMRLFGITDHSYTRRRAAAGPCSGPGGTPCTVVGENGAWTAPMPAAVWTGATAAVAMAWGHPAWATSAAVVASRRACREAGLHTGCARAGASAAAAAMEVVAEEVVAVVVEEAALMVERAVSVLGRARATRGDPGVTAVAEAVGGQWGRCPMTTMQSRRLGGGMGSMAETSTKRPTFRRGGSAAKRPFVQSSTA